MTIRLAQPAGDSTFRNIVHISLGGPSVRVTLTNEFGVTPLEVGNAHIAYGAGDGSIRPSSDHRLTFGGNISLMIPAGGFVVSDPVPMSVDDRSDLAVSVYLPNQTIANPTCHQLAESTNYIVSGDNAGEATIENARTYTSWCFVKGIDVQAGDKAATIVALGDSITDGARSTLNANRRWTDYLALRLREDKKTAHFSVLNQGISGNRILFDGAGPNAISRFDRDVLAQPRVKYLVILEAINDIGRIGRPGDPGANVTAQDLIYAVTQLVLRAHQHGITVFGGTLTPVGGAAAFTPPKEQVRQAYNTWIRSGGIVDGVIDFDKAVQDPKSPLAFLPTNDSGDHVHPNDAGYKAMADSIDLKIFR